MLAGTITIHADESMHPWMPDPYGEVSGILGPAAHARIHEPSMSSRISDECDVSSLEVATEGTIFSTRQPSRNVGSLINS